MNKIRPAFLVFIFFGISFIIKGQPKSRIQKSAIPGGIIYIITITSENYIIDSARYSIFIPNGLKQIQGVLIHQHGCTMEGRGQSTAYDLQYQAFAKKWNLAIVGPDLYSAKSNCHAWKDPVSGSGPALIQALEEIGKLSRFSELAIAPWLLWGHSGGGYWSQAMLAAFPEKVMALFSYSPGLNASFNYPEKAKEVPVLIRHAGPLGDACCWQAALTSFHQLRKGDGFVGIARNEFQNHNFSFVRYLAIPFFESVMRQRLPFNPENGYKDLRKIDRSKNWLGDTTSFNIYKATEYIGNKQSAAWFPDSLIAAKWREFVITGSIIDRTPPPAPYQVKINRRHNVTIELSWSADADIESGISHFYIYKDNQVIGRFPSIGSYQNFDTNGDDAIPLEIPEMKMDIQLPLNDTGIISISMINHFGLESVRTTIKTDVK